MESHILSTLHSKVQQLILIGDHQQLRPKVANHNLSCESTEGLKYRLDLSMFERLQEPIYKFPLLTLSTQRRMRPDIADFVRQTLYKDLEDGTNVRDYVNVPGMGRNIYFMHHENAENQESSKAHSHSNQFETKYCVELTRYILRQVLQT